MSIEERETRPDSIVTMPANDMHRIIKALALAVSTDKHGPECLRSICFDGGEMVATNRYMMAAWSPTISGHTGPSFTINAKELLDVLKLAPKDGTPAVLKVSGEAWTLETVGRTATGGAGSEFPNWRGLLAQAHPPIEASPFEATGFTAEYLELVGKISRSVADTGLQLTRWVGPTKPMIFVTTREDGTLTQMLMPARIN